MTPRSSRNAHPMPYYPPLSPPNQYALPLFPYDHPLPDARGVGVQPLPSGPAHRAGEAPEGAAPAPFLDSLR